MASVPVGRIIYTRRALPAVELVNFALDQGDIVIRTDRSGKLAAAARGAVVAFEADHLDMVNRVGWSVTAIGQASEVTDPDEIARLREIHLSSWAPGERDHFIRISPQLINGRYLRAADEHPATGPPAGRPNGLARAHSADRHRPRAAADPAIPVAQPEPGLGCPG